MRTHALLGRVNLTILFLVISACGCGAPATTAIPWAAGDPSVETFLGDTVEADGYWLTVLTVEDPAVPSALYFPEEGKRLVAVEIVVGNMSGARFSVNPLKVTLVDQEGRSYGPELGGCEGQLATTVIDSGERVRGWVAFKVPTGAIPTALKMSKEIFGEAFFRIGILPPPGDHTPILLQFERVKPSLPGVGETVTGGGYSMKVLTIQDPAVPSVLYLIEPGQRLVAVEVVVGNVWGGTLAISPLYFVLVDSQGFVYPVTVGATSGQIESVELHPGEKVRGWVAFSVPEDVTVESLKFIPLVVSDQSLQVDLTR